MRLAGMDFCGSRASRPMVDTASKPMYAKKRIAVPCITPDQPYTPYAPVFGGMKGAQFAGCTCPNPTATTTRIASTFATTITLLNPADRRTPPSSTSVQNAVISTAGRSINVPVQKTWYEPRTSKGDFESASGSDQPN